MSVSRRQRAAFAIAAALPLAAMAAPGVVIQQVDRAFAVSSVKIALGGTINFANNDEFDHQVYIDSPAFSFDSDEQAPGGSITVTFTKSGTFEVRCHIHPKMHLRVEVMDHS